MAYEDQFLIFLVPGILDDPTVKDKITTSKRWSRNVRNTLCRIGASRVGNILLRSIAYHGDITTIQPFSPTKPIGKSCNAVMHHGWTTLDATNIGAVISFTPEFYGRGTACETKNLQRGGFAAQGHEVLFHELVHAFRHSALRRAGGQKWVGSLDKGLVFYNELEEFYAVLIQGIYASEFRQPIRSSHTGTFPIDKKLEGSYLFFKSGTQTYDAVAILCEQNRGFTKALSKINTHFNPIRAYYEDPQKAKEFSNSEMARSRDDAMPIVKGLYDFLRKIL